MRTLFEAKPDIPVSLTYMVLISLAEIIGALYSRPVGVIFQVIILFALVIHSTLRTDTPMGKMLLALTLAPMTRIASYSVPLLMGRPFVSYVLIYTPIAVATFLVMLRLKMTPREVGFNFNRLSWQAVVAATGIAFGFMEYFVLRYDPLIPNLTWTNAWLPGLALLLTTGFVEEFIFRGVMQRATFQSLGKWNIVYVSFIFAIIHVIHVSFWDIVLVFVIALFFAWCVRKTGSLLGVILGHGITNGVLFLVAPFVFRAMGFTP